MITRAPVTFGISAICVAVTVLGRGPFELPWSWFSWALHADGQHLVSDVGVFLLVGAFVEPRAGAGRFAMWLLAGYLVSLGIHRAVYPGQAGLFGLSAVVWTMAVAAAYGGIDGKWVRRGVVALIVAVLWTEHLVPWREVFGLIRGGAAPAWPRILGSQLGAVPWVHDACAVSGLGLGFLWRLVRASDWPLAPRNAGLRATSDASFPVPG